MQIFSKVAQLEPNKWRVPTLQETQCNVIITSQSVDKHAFHEQR